MNQFPINLNEKYKFVRTSFSSTLPHSIFRFIPSTVTQRLKKALRSISHQHEWVESW